MVSNRQLKAAELIKRSLFEIFNQGKFTDPILLNSSITVTEVSISPDLRVAQIFVFPLAGQIENDEILKALTKEAKMIRVLVTKKIDLKYSPELIFRLDQSFNNFNKIDNILKKINNVG